MQKKTLSKQTIKLNETFVIITHKTPRHLSIEDGKIW